jgi:5-dehydro-2-deoxygluconokinase
MDLSRVYMLASDHRWQWEEWCDGAGVPRPRISEVKNLVVDAFLQARERSDDVRHYGALLLDHKYGSEAVMRARAAGAPVGTPVERAGTFPLEWQDEPFHTGLPGNAFAKVLVRYRPEWADEARRGQMAKLLDLQSWCRAERMPLLIEIIIMREHEDEREFEEHGRPLLLSSVIRQAYAQDLVPDIWKIEGTRSASGATIIDDAIRERQGPRQLILGKGADPATIAAWFDAAAGLPATAGFAIGRSVFWGPGTAFLTGGATAVEVVETMSRRYLDLIDEWHRRRRAAGAIDEAPAGSAAQ